MDPNCTNRKLVNKLGRHDLEKRLSNESFKRITFSFYRYVIINDPHQFRNQLFEKLSELNCLGRIYVATEGINAQMNVPEANFQYLKEWFESIKELSAMPLKIAIEESKNSFLKLTIKVKKQIVADGLSEDEYDVTNVGTHLNAEDWNKAIDEGAILVDMRNYYESEIGHFGGAIRPKALTFREELPLVLNDLKDKKDKKILLYCTGGVRCEKASAYLKHHGFKEVNQLLGGIIDYKRQVDNYGLENKFKGKNFVFDNRLGERVSNEIVSKCHQCGAACDTHTNCNNKPCNLLFIQCPNCASRFNNCCSDVCQSAVESGSQQLDTLKMQPNKRFFLAV